MRGLYALKELWLKDCPSPPPLLTIRSRLISMPQICLRYFRRQSSYPVLVCLFRRRWNLTVIKKDYEIYSQVLKNVSHSKVTAICYPLPRTRLPILSHRERQFNSCLIAGMPLIPVMLYRYRCWRLKDWNGCWYFCIFRLPPGSFSSSSRPPCSAIRGSVGMCIRFCTTYVENDCT